MIPSFKIPACAGMTVVDGLYAYLRPKPYVIPASEPESYNDAKFQDSGSSTRNDGVFLTVLFVCRK